MLVLEDFGIEQLESTSVKEALKVAGSLPEHLGGITKGDYVKVLAPAHTEGLVNFCNDTY